jgi:hypothetical protein
MRPLTACSLPALLLTLFLLLGPGAASAQSTGRALNGMPLVSPAALAADVDDDGDADVVLLRQRDDERPAAVLWLENTPERRFPARPLFTDDALLRVGDLARCDCDGDGRTDYVVADRGTTLEPGQLAWYQQQADGAFVKWTIRPNADVDQIDVADVDGNGTPDVVAVGFDQTTADVYLNDGALGFDRRPIATGLNGVDTVTSGDVDNDGDVDVALGGSIYAKLFRNQGDGTFDGGQDLFTWNDLSPSLTGAIAMADLNDDGATDLLTFAGIGTGGLYFLDGSRNFDQQLLIRIRTDLGGGLRVADLDGDGRLDIVRQHVVDDRLDVLYQTAPMTFELEALERRWDNRGRSRMALADLDGDDDLDLVFPENSNVDGDVAWFENVEGRLLRRMIVDRLKGIAGVAVGDVTGDGRSDVVAVLAEDVITENEVVLYENQPSGFYRALRVDDDLDGPAGLALGDVDGDGVLDVIATGENAGTLVWYRREGPTWARRIIEDAANRPRGIATADLNGNGALDAVLASFGEDRVFWYENDGAGLFARRIVDVDFPSPVAVETADLDADGDADVVVAGADPAAPLAVYLNGPGSFARSLVPADRAVSALAVGDWTGDGAPDLAVGYADGDQTLALFTNNGNAAFAAAPFVSEDVGITALGFDDLDRDGDPDLIVGRSAPFGLRSAVQTIENAPGTPGPVRDVLTPRAAAVRDVAAGALDGDNRSVVVADDGADALLAFDTGTVIPVELATFSGTYRAGTVDLGWTTASETNNAGFAVLRRAPGSSNASPGGGRWVERGFVPGAGTTQTPRRYRFVDRDLPFAGSVLTYRLRQVDADGSTTLTGPVTVARPAPATAALHGVVPNPARQTATVRYALPIRAGVRLAIHDLLGRRVALIDRGPTGSGPAELTVNVEALPPGLYVVTLQAGGHRMHEPLVVVR